MAPKGGNAKKESGRAKKAENAANLVGKRAAEKVHHWMPYLIFFLKSLISSIRRNSKRLSRGKMV